MDDDRLRSRESEYVAEVGNECVSPGGVSMLDDITWCV